MNVSAWSIRHPMPAILLFVVLIALGMWSFMRLPITYFPVIDSPTISVTISQTGAAPANMETDVAKPVEDAIATLTGIDEIMTTITEGQSTTVVEFDLAVPVDRAMADVRDAVARIRQDLPGGIDEPLIERHDADSAAVVTYAVSATGMTQGELSWYVDDTVIRQLQGLPGVGRVDRIGGMDREIQIALDPLQLEALGLTAAGIAEQLTAHQVDMSGGRSEAGARDMVVVVSGAATSLAEIGALTVALPAGGSVRLSDVATIRDTFQERRSFATLNGQDVIGFQVFRTSRASDVSVADEVAGALAASSGDGDVSYTLIDDTVTFSKGNYSAAIKTLEEGALLAIVVVFLFLRDWRATLVAAVALPLSIIPTFFVIAQLDFSLNIISLLAITLVTGILVDDAIVEIENIVRHRARGKSPWRAALDASDEIGLAVLAISASIIAVFAPVGFMGGVAGQYFRQFGLTVAIAVFFSLLVARLITPVLAAYFMRSAPHHQAPRGRLMTGFERFLTLAVRWRRVTVIAAIVVFSISIRMLGQIPGAFVPEMDTGRATLSMELPAGSTLTDTRAASDAAATALAALPQVARVLVQGGTSPAGLQEVRRAAISVTLIPRAERLSAMALEPAITAALAPIPDARFDILNDRGGREVSFGVRGSDGEATDAAARDILAQMVADPMFVAPSSSIAALRPELRFTVATGAAADLGVSAASILHTIQLSTLGDSDANLPVFLDGARQIPMRVQLAPGARDDLDMLRALRVPAQDGSLVSLASVTDMAYGASVTGIDRQNRQRQIEIGADMAPGMASGQGLARIATYDLPPGVSVTATGESDAQGDIFASFLMAIVTGITLVTVVLILLFGSLFTPLTILAAIPLSICGVVAALMLTGHALSLPVVIGILMLVGIVTKNSIMLVDFAVEHEVAGMDRRRAVVEAACERFRPIAMTTLAMVAGMVPTALGLGTGGEFRAPMAIVVIGGLIASTVLSLVVIPALHSLMADFSDAAGRWTVRRLRPNPAEA